MRLFESPLRKRIEREIKALFDEIELLHKDSVKEMNTKEWAHYICKKGELNDKIKLLQNLLR